MPSLLLFAPCERVAFDQKDNSASLINVFQGFHVLLIEHSPDNLPTSLPGAAVLVAGNALPIRWVVFSLWRRVDADEGKTFEQICELVSPSGQESFKAKLPFKMTKDFQRNVMNVSKFPIGENGEYSIKLYLSEGGGEPQLMGSYPVSITHLAGDADETKTNK